MIDKIVYDNAKLIAFGNPPLSKSESVIKSANEYAGYLYNFATDSAKKRLKWLGIPIERLAAFYSSDLRSEGKLFSAFVRLIDMQNLPTYRNFIILSSLLAISTQKLDNFESVHELTYVSHRLYLAFSENRNAYPDNAVHIDVNEFYVIGLIMNAMKYYNTDNFIVEKSDRKGVFLDIE